MKDNMEKVYFVSTVLRDYVDVSNIPVVVFLLQKLKQRNIWPSRDQDELQSMLLDIAHEYSVDNTFKHIAHIIKVYNTIYDVLDWELVLACIDNNNTKTSRIPQVIIEQFEARFDSSKQNILICEGEKFAPHLKHIIDKHHNCDFTITVQQHINSEIIKGVFCEYSNVQVIETDIYQYGFTNQKFDLILSAPRFGSRLLVNLNQSFICREYEMVATENLLLHLSVEGKLLIVLPAKITFGSGRIQKLRNFIQEMYKIEEISELPPKIFPSTGIKTFLLTISSGKTEDVNIKRYISMNTKNNMATLEIKDETFVMLSELIDIGDWNVDKIFATQDDSWQKYKESGTKKVALGKLAEIFRGKVVNYTDDNGRIGVVNISNLREFDIDYNSLYHLDDEDRKINNYILKSGDLLLPARGTAMKTAVFQEQNYPCIASANIIVIRPKERQLSGTYLKIFFDSEIGNKIIKATQQGTTVMNISYKDLANIQIPLVSFEEQKQIEDEYQSELKLYHKNIKEAEDRWSNVVKHLQTKL